MQADVTQNIFQEVPMLSEEDQKKVLETVDHLLNERSPKPLSEIFEELSGQIPIEDWQDLPSDGAENHDHYLYGAPKKD
jgi:hypothetical protein